MKLHILSDLHLELQTAPFKPTTAATKADVIILAGDIGVGTSGVEWAARTFPDKPVIYVPGNHEYYGGEIDGVLRAMLLAASGTNVHVLDMNEVVIGGVRFLGATLWTDFKLYGAGRFEVDAAMAVAVIGLTDFGSNCIRYGDDGGVRFTPEESARMHAASLAWLESALAVPFDGPTVVVTHHAPSSKSIEARFENHPLSPCFASNLDDLVARADLWIHGHTHSAFDYRIGNGRVICNPRGYVFSMHGGNGGEKTGWDSRLLVEI